LAFIFDILVINVEHTLLNKEKGCEKQIKDRLFSSSFFFQFFIFIFNFNFMVYDIPPHNNVSFILLVNMFSTYQTGRVMEALI